MKQARHLCTLAFCCLFSLAATAQGNQSVNLSVASSQDVSLDGASCSATITPALLLMGDFDADDDGTDVPLSAFRVEVLTTDLQPTGSNVINGTGDFMARVTLVNESQMGFNGDFDLEGANFMVATGDNSTITSDGSSLVFSSNSTAAGTISDDDDAMATLTFTQAGTVNFNTLFTAATGSLDAATISFNGNDVPFVDGTFPSQTVVGGDRLTFTLTGDDTDGQDASTLTLDNFVFSPAGSMTVDGFTMLMAAITAVDKTPPVLQSPAMSVEGLLCVDVESNNVNALAPSPIASRNIRCYRVEGSTGATIAGSMDPALRAVLSAQAFDADMPNAAMVPTFFDACAAELQVCVSDVVTRTGDDRCGQTVITRTFAANEITGTAANGAPVVDTENTATSSYTLTFDRLTFADVDTTNFLTVYETPESVCATEAIAIATVPNDTLFPQIVSADGRTFSVLDGVAGCSNIYATYSNSLDPARACEFTYKFMRVYTVYDWCEPDSVMTFRQLVKIGDTQGPALSVPGFDATGAAVDAPEFATNVDGECAARIRLDDPAITLTDDCSADTASLSVLIYPDGDVTRAPFGVYDIDLNNEAIQLSDPLPPGAYSFEYTAMDACKNTTMITVPFTVVDGTAPVAICEPGLNVSLARDAAGIPVSATVTPEMVDAGSYDDCDEDNVSYQVARSNSMTDSFDPTLLNFQDEISFDGADVDQPRFITLEVTDQANNANYCWLEVLVENKDGNPSFCDGPQVSCESTRDIVLMDNGNGVYTAEVIASDLVLNQPVLDCDGNEVTRFGIARSNGGTAANASMSITLTCADVGDFVNVSIYAFDNIGGDQTPCRTRLTVNTTQANCGSGGGNLTGRVLSISTVDPMEAVEMTLTGSSDMDDMRRTDEQGRFTFDNLPFGDDYTVTPAYYEPVNLREVKVSDVVAISRVILGQAEFSSVYDYIAADVDQSKALNVLDMVAIQRVILGLDEGFDTKQSWGFVPGNVAIENPYLTAFPSVFNVNNLESNVLDADFVAFAYGNVTTTGRSASYLNVNDIVLAAGEVRSIEITSGDLAAYQGTFELGAGLELLNTELSGDGAVNTNYAASGVVAVVLRGASTVTLTVRATEAGHLSEMLALTDALAVREGVAANGSAGSLDLNFAPVAGSAYVTGLGAAVPNPVVETTKIHFTLAEAGDATISVRDLQGRTVLVRSIPGVAGSNYTTLSAADFGGATGVLTYTLTTNDYSATKKMVVSR